MKIFHRALAMVLALIMSLAVLPLGTFASEPWIEVGSGNQTTTPDDSGESSKSLVVRVNADKLAEILQSTGVSSALLAELQSGIVIDIASLLEVFTVDEILDIIPADAIISEQNVDINELFEELGERSDEYFELQGLGVNAYIETYGARALLEQLSPEEVAEIWKLETVQSAIPNLITLVLSNVLYDINQVSIDDYTVATENPDTPGGALMFDLNALLASVINKLPKLEDIAALEDGKLLSFNIALEYEYKDEDDMLQFESKKFALEVVIDGDIEKVKSAASKLDSMISDFFDYDIKYDLKTGLDLTVDLKIPAQFASLYSSAIQQIDADKRNELLAIVDFSKTLDEFVRELETDDIKLILDAVDVDTLLDKLGEIEYTKSLLEKLAETLEKDVSELTKDEIVTLMEEKFDQVKEKLISVLDRVASLSPELLNTPLEDMYQGNGVFDIEAKLEKTVNVQDLAVQLMDKALAGKFDLSEDMTNYIRSFFPEAFTLNAKADATVAFTNMYRVTYHDINAKVLLDTFMPSGTELSVVQYNPTETEVSGWQVDNVPVTSVDGDLLVFPVFEGIEVYFYDSKGLYIGQVEVYNNATISPNQLSGILGRLDYPAYEDGYDKIYTWVLDYWYDMDNSDSKTPFDLFNWKVTESKNFAPEYKKEFIDPVYGEYTHPTEGGYIISVDDLFADATVITIPEYLIEYENADVTLYDPENGVKITIPDATLDALAGEDGEKVAIKYQPNATFSTGYYNEGNAVQYTFDFLIGDAQKSYIDLLAEGEDRNFKESVSITVPFAAITPDAGVATHVYHTTADGVRVLMNSEVVSTSDGTFVTFQAPHFSDFVIANEYAVYYRFKSQNKPEDTVVGNVGFDEVHGTDGYTYLPAGTVSFTPTITSPANYALKSAYTNDGAFADEGTATDGWKITVVNAPVYLTVVAETTETHTVTFLFNVHGSDDGQEPYVKTFEVIHGCTLEEAIEIPKNFFDTMGDIRIEYGFAYWKNSAGEIIDPSAVEVTGDLTFVGKAEEVARYFKVSFHNYNGDFYYSDWVKNGETLSAEQIEALGVPARAGEEGKYKYDFAAWLDAEGEAIDLGTAVVSVPVVYTAGYDVSYCVYFKYEDGTEYDKIWVTENGTIQADDEYVAAVPTMNSPEGLDQYLFNYEFQYWKLDDAEFDLENTKITASIELIAAFEENYLINEVNPDIADQVFAEFDGNTYIVCVEGSLTSLKLPNLIKQYVEAFEDAKVIVRIVDKDGNALYDLLKVEKTMLNHLYADTTVVSLTYQALAEFEEGVYNETNAMAFKVGFVCDGTEYVLDADDQFTVRVPFEWLSKNYNGHTLIYQIVDGELVLVGGDKVTQANGKKVVMFTPDAISTFIVVNEYGLTDGGATHGDDNVPATRPEIEASIDGFDSKTYYAAGTAITLTPKKVSPGYKVEGIYYIGADGKPVKLEKVENSDVQWTLVVPNHSVELMVSLVPVEYKVNYYVMVAENGIAAYQLVKNYLYDGHELANDAAAVNAEHLAILEELLADETLYIPAAYVIDTWVGYDETKLGTVDMNVYLTFKPIEYTLNLIDPADGSVVESIVFNTESTDLGELVIPNKKGHTAACPDFATFNIQAAIEEMIANETTSTSIEVVYTPCTYSITYDETAVSVSGDAIFGNEITLEVIDKEYHKATVEVVTVNGTKITVKDNKFIMPDAAVKVVVTYTSTGNAVYYINNRPCYGATVGDVATFEVRFTKGYRMASVSEGCSLISSRVDGDMYILVYAFDVVDGMRIEYAIEEVAYDGMNIVNGTEHQGTGKPIVEEDNVTFKGWSANLLGSISFAIFGTEDTSCLIWLWILLALIVLIAVIAILYKLFALGKLKNNFITRFVAWIVSGFLAVCRFFAGIALAVLGFFGKKEEDFDCSATEEAEAEDASEAAPETEAAEAQNEIDEPKDNE